MKIIISRTDSIGDVILTLPLCGWIKQNIPDVEVIFLCQKLTKAIISRSEFVDEIIIWAGELPEADVIIHVFPNKEVALAAKRSRIPLRIGTSHRMFHLTTCNKLVNFSRVNSQLHESQLNFKLLKGLGLNPTPLISKMSDLIGWKNINRSSNPYLESNKFNIIFHIKSRGSAKEWLSTNYLELARLLPSEYFHIVLTGTKQEGELIEEEIPEILEIGHVADTTGQLNLNQLIDLIGQSDGLLACSTGPLHIAGISGIRCLGLYPQKKPMHAGRWGPLGLKSEFIEEANESKDKFLDIRVDEVHRKIMEWIN